MSKAWAKGSTPAWRRVRAQILARDHYRCRIATSGTWTDTNGKTQHCRGRADCVHHTRGKAHGDDPDYLVAACTPCNLRIGDPTKHHDPPPNPRTKW